MTKEKTLNYLDLNDTLTSSRVKSAKQRQYILLVAGCGILRSNSLLDAVAAVVVVVVGVGLLVLLVLVSAESGSVSNKINIRTPMIIFIHRKYTIGSRQIKE